AARMPGRTTWRHTANSEAPSSRAASMRALGTPSRAARKMMKDQPTPFQMLSNQMTPFAVQVWAVQGRLSVPPEKNQTTDLATPPRELNNEAKTQLTTPEQVTTGR